MIGLVIVEERGMSDIFSFKTVAYHIRSEGVLFPLHTTPHYLGNRSLPTSFTCSQAPNTKKRNDASLD